MTTRENRNRRYNLIIATSLFLIGLGMGLYALGEGEAIDRIDDVGLLAVGLIAALWYLAGRPRLERSVAPLALTVLALAVQALGVVLEIGDREAFGDNVAGMVLLVPLTLFALWQYLRRPTRIRRHPSGEEAQVTARVGRTE
jgi:peptidoglycan/LPS O-acetylase OafA/YrhL